MAPVTTAIHMPVEPAKLSTNGETISQRLSRTFKPLGALCCRSISFSFQPFLASQGLSGVAFCNGVAAEADGKAEHVKARRKAERQTSVCLPPIRCRFTCSESRTGRGAE